MACKYTIDTDGGKMTFDSKESLIQYIRDNQFYNKVVTKVTADSHTTDALAKALRQTAFGESHFKPEALRAFQETMLEMFTTLEDQSQHFYKAGMPIALTKGLGKSFDTIDKINQNLRELGVGAKLEDNVAFDLRYLLTGNPMFKEAENTDQYYHKITANNVRVMKEIDSLSRTMFMERTPSFINVGNKVIANLKPFLSADKTDEIKNELTAFAQIAAYKEWIKVSDKQTSSLRNTLIYDNESATPTIVNIVKEAQTLAPTNAFLQFVLPVSTTVKVGKKQQKNILNRDLINTIEGKTRGKLEPDVVSSLMDSFTELYQNPTTRFHAKALFDYLIVKDGLMFKNKSFIRMLPTAMFTEMSEATDTATKLMAANSTQEFKRLLKDLSSKEIVDKEGNFVEYFSSVEKQAFNKLFKEDNLTEIKDKLYTKIFGMDYEDLYDKFEEIYASDVRNQFNLELIRPTKKGKTTLVEGIKFYKDDKNGKNYMHISLFPDTFKSLPKGSEERKKKFGEIVDGLGGAGFFISAESVSDKEKPENNKTYLEFKKHIRIRGAAGVYQTFRLVSVRRDKKDYMAHMTPKGELVPRGTYAIYSPIDTVGTSNSTGVANLGTRPTKTEISAFVSAKTKKNEPAPTSLIAAIPDTPMPARENAPTQTIGEGTVSGGVFGGLQQLDFNTNEIGDAPLDFFSDEDINQEPC